MDLPDRGRRQRAADVHPAPIVTVVRIHGAVLEERLPAAPPPTARQLGVERVEDRAVERTHLLRTDQRTDVTVRQLPVRRDGVRFEGEDREVLVEQLVERGAGPRVAALVDLVGEAAHDLVGLSRG